MAEGLERMNARLKEEEERYAALKLKFDNRESRAEDVAKIKQLEEYIKQQEIEHHDMKQQVCACAFDRLRRWSTSLVALPLLTTGLFLAANVRAAGWSVNLTLPGALSAQPVRSPTLQLRNRPARSHGQHPCESAQWKGHLNVMAAVAVFDAACRCENRGEVGHSHHQPSPPHAWGCP
jgi:hypothetical protein